MSKDYTLRSYEDLGDIEPGSSHFELVQRIKPDSRVLDVGCATGYLASALAKRGCEMYGIDINPKAAEAARAHCTAVVCDDLDAVTLLEAFPAVRFDYIIFGDVLEHLRDPWRTLEGAREVLVDRGHVVASIPNAAHGALQLALLQGEFDYQEFGLLDSTHLRFFTLDTVKELFLRTGFHIEAIERTKYPIFTDGGSLVPSVAREDFDERVIELVEAQSESSTLQFIIDASSVPDSERSSMMGDYIAALRRELSAAQRALHRSQPNPLAERVEQLRVELSESQKQLSVTRDHVTTLTRQNANLMSRSREIESALDIRGAEIAEMKRSKFWKARLVWLSLRRRFRKD